MAAGDLLTAQQTIDFSLTTGGGGRIIIEETPLNVSSATTTLAMDGFTNATHALLVYPYEVTRMIATAGIIGDVNRIGQRVEAEFLTFSGSNTATPKYPVYAYQELDLNFAFDVDGELLTNLNTVTFRIDPETGSVIASKVFTGVVRFVYITVYREWWYEPYTEYTSTNWGMFPTEILYGVLAAFHNGTFITYAMSPHDSPWEGAQDRLEIYRIVSEVLATENGAWETPDGWPNKTWNAGSDYPDPPTSDSYVNKWQRVHEIGYVKPKNTFIFRETFSQRNEKPKSTDTSYTPKYKLEKISAGEAKNLNVGLKFSYDNLDWGAIESDLKKRFKGLIL